MKKITSNIKRTDLGYFDTVVGLQSIYPIGFSGANAFVLETGTYWNWNISTKVWENTLISQSTLPSTTGTDDFLIGSSGSWVIRSPQNIKSILSITNIDNTSDANKPVSTAQATAIGEVDTKIDNHLLDLNNPHEVDKNDVGLSNVDNTSDLNKPISTATQTALDKKQEYLSVGLLTDAILIDNEDGTATINDLDCTLCDNPNNEGTIKKYSVIGQTLSFIDGHEEYVCIKYNSGNPIIYKEAIGSVINNSDIIPVFVTWRQGTTIHSKPFDRAGLGLVNKIQSAEYHKALYVRSSDGGLMLSETSTPVARTILLSSSLVYTGAVKQIVDSFNSSIDQLTQVNVASGIWYYNDYTIYNNTQYNPSSGLVNLSPNSFSVIWFYRSIGDDKQVFYVLSNEEYNKIATAELAKERNDIPLLLKKHCILVGRIIIQNGANSGVVESAFDTTFSASSIINHNDTSNIQGGTTNEYYHLTNKQYTEEIVNRQFGDVTTVNYSQFESDGTYVAYGNATTYEDIQMPLLSANTSILNPPTLTKILDNGIGSRGIYAYAFSASSINDVQLACELNHTYEEGSDIEFHVHWYPETTNIGNVVFELEYALNNIGDTLSNTTVVSKTDTTLGIAKNHMYTTIVNIPASDIKISAGFTARLSRLGNNLSDTYTGSVYITRAALHIKQNTLGSRVMMNK